MFIFVNIINLNSLKHCKGRQLYEVINALLLVQCFFASFIIEFLMLIIELKPQINDDRYHSLLEGNS
jgi:hypothetical protein